MRRGGPGPGRCPGHTRCRRAGRARAGSPARPRVCMPPPRRRPPGRLRVRPGVYRRPGCSANPAHLPLRAEAGHVPLSAGRRGARARAPAACAAARAAAVASFGEAVGAAPGALAALPARELAGVLADDGLEATELEAFSAVAAWCGAAPEARARALPHLVSAGVRLATLPPGALAALDAHPSVRACPETTRAVATAYVRLFVAAPRGGVHDGRRCEWATAAAAKAASPSPSSPSPSSPSPPPPALALPPGGAETPPRRLRPSPGSVRVLAKRLCLE